METRLSKLNYQPKEILIRTNIASNFVANNQSSTQIPKDNINFSSIATQKEPPKTEEKSSITSFGEKYFNQPILNHYKEFRNDRTHQPIIAQIDKAIHNGISIKDLEKLAVNTTKSIYSKLDTEDTLDLAYNSILASVIDNKYSDPNFFNGEKDKVFHYFVSGSLTIKAAKNLPLMPLKMKASVAGGSVLTLGFLKEVGSIPGNGYSSEDMDANTKGIDAVKRNLILFNKNKTL